MKEILIISQYFTPDITAAAYRIKDFYEGLLDNKQFEVDIITTYPHKSEIKETIQSEKNIYRIDINRKLKNKILNYLYQYFYFSFKAYWLSLKIKKKYDVVFVTSPPIFTLIPAYIISKKYKSKLIIDIRDIWPDSAVAVGMISDKSIFYKSTKKLEKYMYKKADTITCVSNLMKKYISQYTEKSKVKVLYNGVSERDIRMIKTLNEKKEHDFSNKKLKLFYAGNIGLAQKLDILIQAFEEDVLLNNKIEIHLIGEGALRNELLLKAEEKNINIQYYGSLTKNETVKTLYKNADILFLALEKKEAFKNTIPSKVFDYLLINKPIVYGIEGGGKEIFDNLKCGEYFDVEKEENLIDVLNKIYNEYKYYYDNSQSNLEYVINNYDRSEIFKKFINSI